MPVDEFMSIPIKRTDGAAFVPSPFPGPGPAGFWHMTMDTIAMMKPELHAELIREHPLWEGHFWVHIDGVNPPKLLEFVDPVFNQAMKDT